MRATLRRRDRNALGATSRSIEMRTRGEGCIRLAVSEPIQPLPLRSRDLQRSLKRRLVNPGYCTLKHEGVSHRSQKIQPNSGQGKP